jgi:hypothetical protein
MEELRTELAALKEKHAAILKETEKYQKMVSDMEGDSRKVKIEISEIEYKMLKLLPGLTYGEKKDIKRELDQIGEILKTNLMYYSERNGEDEWGVSIYLVDTTDGTKWKTSLEGTMNHMKIMIHTNSDSVKHIVRSCLLQGWSCGFTERDDTETERKERSKWYQKRNGCCLDSIGYDAKVLETLLDDAAT